MALHQGKSGTHWGNWDEQMTLCRIQTAYNRLIFISE